MARTSVTFINLCPSSQEYQVAANNQGCRSRSVYTVVCVFRNSKIVQKLRKYVGPFRMMIGCTCACHEKLLGSNVRIEII